ncbi:MAG TPA: metallophosphoesterase [Verrucomicrobiota bacterium]|nr:metallophosphoesterase [Verrucomicrobiota bacterium]HNU53260.1 metallophosphoesterase [Verrucomicrobiota bacterium]
MTPGRRIAVVSDIHYASPGETARAGFEQRVITSPLLRWLARQYRHHLWMRDPLVHNHLIDQFLAHAADADAVVANGDYSCDSAFVGVSDPAACESARICLERLRTAFPDRTRSVLGDHELGKMSLFGGQGGPRLASWRVAVDTLRLEPFWRWEWDRFVLFGVTSTLLALPVFEPEILPEERAEWRALREQHLDDIRANLRALATDQRIVLFCHDPTALPFLWREGVVRACIDRIALTIIGHLHTPLVFRLSRILAGMPRVRFLGNTARRLSEALHQARLWRPFRVRLCPSLAGCELLKDGGFGWLELDPASAGTARLKTTSIPATPVSSL